MAVTAKRLKIQSIAATNTAIYTDASNVSVLHSMVIHNTNATSENVKLYHNDGSTDFLLYNLSIDADDTLHIQLPGEGMVLEANDVFKGETTTVSVVNIELNGSVIT